MSSLISHKYYFIVQCSLANMNIILKPKILYMQNIFSIIFNSQWLYE